jgi:hypothetical protein
MRRLISLAALLLALGCDAQAEPAAVPPAALAMIPAEHRTVRGTIDDIHRWTLFIVTDERLVQPGRPPQGADVVLKLQESDPAFFKANCAESAEPICVFSKLDDPSWPRVSIAGTLFVIRGDGCVYSASDTEQPHHPVALHCLVGVVGKPGELTPQPMTGLWP